MKYEKNVMTWT